MRIIILTCLTLVIAAAPAFATDIFVKKNKDNALPDAPAVQEQYVPPAPSASPAPGTASTAPAQTPAAQPETMEDFAERYNENCLKQKNPVLNGEPLRMLCACSASKLQETMTVDEVKAMMTDTPEGLKQRNRMAIIVYAPCMEYPVRALYYHNCNQNQEILKQYKNADNICTCMADDMAAFIAKNAPAILSARLATNPNDPGPLGGLMSSPDMEKRAQASFIACVQRYPVTPQ